MITKEKNLILKNKNKNLEKKTCLEDYATHAQCCEGIRKLLKFHSRGE